MKTLSITILVALGFFFSLSAEETRFFRVSGPVATTITAFSADGYLTWTNLPTTATFTVQAAQNLTGGPNWVNYVQVPVTNRTTTQRLFDPNPPTNMVLIPAGSFTMGDSLNDGSTNELPSHLVYVSAFYMDQTEVNRELWKGVYSWALTNGYAFDNTGNYKHPGYPIYRVNWYDAVKWCNARSEKEGRTPAYYLDPGLTVVYRGSTWDVQATWVNWSSGYRLPTEAEWEKAARGGASGQRFPWAATNITHSMANYYSATNYAYDTSPTRGFHPTFDDGVYPCTSPVGYFEANGYGLHDMAGNLLEWCWDWYGSYASGSQTDPRGPGAGTFRICRGGNWSRTASQCRTAYRYVSPPRSGDIDTGFRSVLPAGQ